MNILEALVQTRNSIQSWVASNLATKADKNYVDEQLDAIADIASASGCKIITGTYVGTGGDGVDGTVSLTFDFAPTVLYFLAKTVEFVWADITLLMDKIFLQSVSHRH